MSTEVMTALDKAAVKLLEWTESEDVSIGWEHKIKAFDAVCEYMSVRAKLHPTPAGPPPKSPFQEIRDEFHGGAGQRRGASARKAKGSPSAPGADSDGDPADPSR